jgi:uncharacterized protein YeaO (DUF488 family)
MIRTKRVYEAPDGSDGTRILVDRFWPRGLKRAEMRVDEWPKDVAPSDALRRWFGHDPGRWPEFVRRYSAELDAKPESWRPILERARDGMVTLLFAARDVDHNNAVALGRYLDARLTHERRHPRRAPVRRSAARRGR